MYLSKGNKKLKSNQFVKFLIWNLPAVKTCPNATALCKKSCYARKAEKAYPTVLPCRENNLKESQKPDFVENMISAIKKAKDKRALIVRIHESGDFYNLEYSRKWLEIATACPDVVFMAYTKSFKYFDGVKLPKNFFLRASVWADTKAEDLETIARNKWTIYTAVEEMTKGFTECRCDDCATCGKCWSKAKKIACKIH